MAPILILTGEAARYRRRPDRTTAMAIALAVVGLTFLVSGAGVWAAAGGAAATGVLLAVVAAGGFACITLLGRRPVPGLDPLSTVGLGFTVGALVLGPICGLTVGLGFAPTPATLGLLGYFAAVPTALAYALYFAGLQRMPAGSAAVVAVLEPLTAALLSAVVLGERLGTAGVVGAALLCVAVLTASRRRREARSGRPR